MSVGYRMVLPESWVRLPANPIAMRPAVRSLLLQLWADQPRDATVQRRRQLEQQLVELGGSASEGGGREVLLCLETAGDVPLAASAVVSLQPKLLDGDEGLSDLAEVSAAGALSSEVLDLGRHRAVVVVRDVAVEDPLPVPDTATPADRDALASALRTTRQVDVHLPVPGEPAILLLSFSTPVAPLFEVYTELFLALAATVQWHREGAWA